MQELLGRLSSLDPEASLSLRVIACFDELIVGNVNTRALLGAAAALAGCNAGFRQDHPPRTLCVTPAGEVCATSHAGEGAGAEAIEGLTVWLERSGPAHANDAIILERLALAVRIRRAPDRQNLDNRREIVVLMDGTAEEDDRRQAAAHLGLSSQQRYRVVVTPLFASWGNHPTVPEDVVPTPYGLLHAMVLPHDTERVEASPSGMGIAARAEDLHRSFRTAIVALRLCDPPGTPSVNADEYGGLIELLANTSTDGDLRDVQSLDEVMAQSWGAGTVDALIRSGSVRQAARLGGVHHSTMQARLDSIVEVLGFDPLDGLGRTRLGIAYLVWRLRHSRVLELPGPARPAASRSSA